MSDKAANKPAVDLMEAMRAIQAHVDAVAEVTGQPHQIVFTGGKDKLGSPSGIAFEIVPGGPGDLPGGLGELLAGLAARRRQPPRGSGGDH
ncbi:MAG: hypothetical protein RI911_328 [Candidatus Parcubacteria bacterium]|jgi:hypothetical protein